MTTRHRSPATALVLAGLLLTGLAGCGSDAGTSSDGDTRAQVSVGSVDGFADLFADHRADYDHIDTPAALADRSTLVVQGRIVRIDEGRNFGTSATDPVASSRIVLVFAVTQVLHGDALADTAGGKVYVELPAPGQVAAEVFDRSAPKASDAVLYLAPAATAADTAIVDPDAGRPAGQPLYQPTNPQGLVIEDGTAVVQILAGVEFPDASLRNFHPTPHPFPKAQRIS
jgi:hypothetical protein